MYYKVWDNEKNDFVPANKIAMLQNGGFILLEKETMIEYVATELLYSESFNRYRIIPAAASVTDKNDRLLYVGDYLEDEDEDTWEVVYDDDTGAFGLVSSEYGMEMDCISYAYRMERVGSYYEDLWAKNNIKLTKDVSE